MSQISKDQVNFSEWFTTFLDEREIDLEDTLEFENSNGWNLFPIGCIVEFLREQDEDIKNQVKTTLVKIDFFDGDVKHFLTYLVKGISNTIQFNY